MFPDELEAAFADHPLLYLTYGLCEPHGPHNALGLDALKADGLACAAARAHGGIVAPPDYWHIHELGQFAHWLDKQVGNVPRAWLSAMPPWQHFKNVCYHVRAADRLGFKAVILLTGHYGANWEDLKTLVALIQPHVGPTLYALPDFEANTRGFYGNGDHHRDHAGKVETSQLLALVPESVDMTRLPKPEAPPPHFALGPDVQLSDRRIGEGMIADQVEWLGRRGREMVASYPEQSRPHRLLTFDDVERLWRDVITPQLPTFKTMTRPEAEPLPDQSVWAANSGIGQWRG
jgi:creatinine amidohydrolase